MTKITAAGKSKKSNGEGSVSERSRSLKMNRAISAADTVDTTQFEEQAALRPALYSGVSSLQFWCTQWDLFVVNCCS
jgi:hypothetical protein